MLYIYIWEKRQFSIKKNIYSFPINRIVSLDILFESIKFLLRFLYHVVIAVLVVLIPYHNNCRSHKVKSPVTTQSYYKEEKF